MTLPENIQTLAESRLIECYQIARSELGKSFPLPELVFNQRGKIAGAAHLQANKIRLNPTLLTDNLAHFLSDVIPHEVCHLLVFQIFGRVKPHGKEWQTMMVDLFGLVPNVHHKLDVSKVKGKEFEYFCECGPIKLSIRRHNKIVRNQQQYICRRCGSNLKPLPSKHAV